MHKAYLSLGSNIADPSAQIAQAIQRLEKHVGQVVACAPLYLTKPVGFESENLFVNTAVCIHTHLTPEALLEQTQQIEQRMGRKEKSHNSLYKDRIIDIDILLYDHAIGTFLTKNQETLTLPHPHVCSRLFVLIPMCDIAPQLIHPVEKKNFTALLEAYLTQHPEEIKDIKRKG